MAYVVVYRGAMLMHHRLGRDAVRIGKSPACELSLPDRSIARHQGVILWEDGRYRFEDRSGKKTLLNGKPVDSAWLKDRDYLDMGAYRVHFEDVELEEPSDLVSAVRTLVGPGGKPTPLPSRIWLNAQRPTGGKVIRLEVGEEPVTIGSGPKNAMRLADDALVSAEHCRLVRHPGALFLSDLGSTNGILARGLPVQVLPLPLRERVRVGEHDIWLSPSLEEALAEAAAFEGIFTQDPRMLQLFERVLAIAAADANVLIHGQTGSGKDLFARAIHRRSPRAAGPFLPVNCGALSPQLLEATLFGAEKGAYTGADASRIGLLEAADGGTLFLDEIGDMPLDLQVKLLRAIDKGEIFPVGSTKARHVNVRFVAGSHRDLPTLARTGRFREDLLYRLNVLQLEVPPLRQRKGDIPLLFNLFARARLTPEMVPVLTPAVLDKLLLYDWPGNVRELETIVTRTLCLMTGKDLRPEQVELNASSGAALPPLVESFTQPGLSLEEVKILAIRAALQRNGGNRTKAAEELDIDRTTLQKRIAEHGLEREGLKDEEEGNEA